MNPIRIFFVCFAVAVQAGCATSSVGQEPFDVKVEVDFGPANKPAIARTVSVVSGATPEQATAQACSVTKGAVCCDAREIAGIDGVAADPGANQWWTVSVNGSKKVSPYKTRLHPNDTVRWEYKKYDQ